MKRISIKIDPMDKRLAEIISIYKRYYKQNADGCISYTKQQKNLVAAIYAAAISRDANNKKHSHQYRLPDEVLEQWSDTLIRNSNRITKAGDFDSLLKLLTELTIPGIGKLTLYDTATRLGAYLNLHPKIIYLHAGTKVGAIKLLGKVAGDAITKEMLPKPFQRKDLACWEIEDICRLPRSSASQVRVNE